jgi:DMSO/TMAO reductase YedYZ molybdopterin-dependent catalytic subunit
MARQRTRREVLKGGLAAAGLGVLGVPHWVLPALAQGAVLVPFTDVPDDFDWEPTPVRRLYDVRRIDGPFTPADEFFTIQHYDHPTVDAAAHRLTVGGLVERPLSLSVADLQAMGGQDLVAGFECSGNRGPMQTLSSNGRWTGVPLRDVLERAGLQADGEEVVFFGADGAEEEVTWRTRTFTIPVRFGRSLPREKALSGEPFLAWALNGAPLTVHQGAPLRLVVPGWYGVANVKWLTDIQVQTERFVGRWQARDYRTVRGEMVDGEMQWNESSIGGIRLKSFVARVTREGNGHRVVGVVLHDGTPIRSVEVRVDDGPWQPATLDAATAGQTYGWKLFSWDWQGATPGEHTLVSRVADTDGRLQPEGTDPNKLSFLENDEQSPRTVRIV